MGLLSSLVRMAVIAAAGAVGGPIGAGIAAGATKKSGDGISGRLTAGLGAGMSKAAAESATKTYEPQSQLGADFGSVVEGAFIPPGMAEQFANDPIGKYALDNISNSLPETRFFGKKFEKLGQGSRWDY
jgi:hypothetical protein